VRGSKALGVLLLGGASAGALLVRRALRKERERIDLYFGDGSVISLGASRPETARLLPLARRLLASARG
jgi:hypothetical protein